ncbi:MFS transporter [Amycolatopsis azurea DSM 43854]|uniref:Cyanate transport system protein n=1 Tax=Amycolatopsis azurea DSM 43854 TaxID=1238180 RepID=M2QTH0_9PSEU|nr:Cyanate transport system protein [Amycolatopsis azurea DSM 43854]OOC08333.1 MFS transporter [Amycolatopsis azurea DSM 43854]
MSEAPARGARIGAGQTPLLVAAFVLLSLNLRIVFGGVGPLIPSLELSHTAATVLTTLPPLCMGLFAPIAAGLRGRLGDERSLFAALVVLVLGILLRSVGMFGLFAGTIVASIGVAVLNVITPVLVKKRFPPERIGVMMGVYAMMMGGGAAAIAALSVPIYRASGGSSAIALGVAVIPAVPALLAFATQLKFGPDKGQAVATKRWSGLLRNRTAWSVTGFFGLQSLMLYTIFAWLPTIYVAKDVDRATAGLYLSICVIAVSVGGFFGPSLAGRRADQRLPVLVTAALCFVGIAGVLLAPTGSAPVWAIVLGLGLGAGQGIPGVLYVARTEDRQTAAQLSSMSQTFGYVIAAAGPLLTAALFAASGSWTLPLVVLLALMVVNAVISLPAGRRGVID